MIVFRRHHCRRIDKPLIRSISLSTSLEMSEFEKFSLPLDEGKECIDSKILDFISGHTLQNCQRKLTSIVAEMVVGTTLKTFDLIQKLPIKGQPQGSVFVASKIMKLLIVRGYRDLPWNEKRREFVAKYFNTNFFPDVGTFTNDKFSSQHGMVIILRSCNSKSVKELLRKLFGPKS